jgi:hypothetical protein
MDQRLARIIRSSPTLMQVLSIARTLDLPQWRLVSGAIYQTVWNALTNRPADYGVKDYDLLYFEGADLSYAAEDAVIKRAAALFPGALSQKVEVRNQSRVHLWFEDHFGEPYRPLSSTDEAIGRFVSPAFAVGVRLEQNDRLSICAPFGLDDLFAMRLRPNPTRPLAAGWQKATASAKARWPEVVIVGP